MVGLLILPAYSFAEDEATLSGSVSVTARSMDGEDESWKFQEYMDIRNTSGDVSLDNEKGDFYLEFRVKDIGESDSNTKVRLGRYGKYRIEFINDNIIHRFANDAKLIYSGKGTDTLTADDTMQSTLAGLSATTTSTNTVPPQAAALASYMNSASVTDLELTRKSTKVNVDVTAFSPLKFRVEAGEESRNGTRPFGMTFNGFSNVVEIPEPISYNTDQLKVMVEYIRKQAYLSGTYYLSTFKNNIDTITVDNLIKTEGGDTNAAGGGSHGRTDLYPDNRYQNTSLTGSVNLPLKSRLAATASWGKMKQNDDFIPYTANTATTNAELATYCTSQLASDPACLPKNSLDGEVDTTLYNAFFTSRPLSFMSLKARYRQYKYDNKTEEIVFPGYVQYDGAWRASIQLYGTTGGTDATQIENLPTSYKKTTKALDLGFDVATATTLTLGYTSDKMERTHREVGDQDETTYKTSIDTSAIDWLSLRASYEKTKREGDYNYMAPFEGELTTVSDSGLIRTAQLPWLRKYDEADRDRNRAQLIATVSPADDLTLTGTYIQGKDDFGDSPFGLAEDNHQIYSLDADYTVSKTFNLYGFYSHEKFDSKQKGRQWNPCNPATDTATTTSCTGTSEGADPYYTQMTEDSYSNWSTENEDSVNTYGIGLKVAVIPSKLDLDLAYSYSKSDGKVKLASAAETNTGTATNEDLNNFTPVDFTEADDTKRQTLDAKAKYSFTENLSFAVGYMWEKFDISDFNLDGFSNVPINTVASTGIWATQSIALMGTLPKDYEASIIYTKLAYKF